MESGQAFVRIGSDRRRRLVVNLLFVLSEDLNDDIMVAGNQIAAVDAAADLNIALIVHVIPRK